MASLRLKLFGYPQITVDGDPVVLHRHKALALLIYLTVTGHPHRRSQLSLFFWPQMDQQHARSCLRRTLMSLRKHLGGKWLTETRETIGLVSRADIWVDVWQFWRGLEEGELLEARADSAMRAAQAMRAIELYSDRFLDGFTLKDAPGFDEWQYFESERLHLALESALDRLIRQLARAGDLDGASLFAHRWLAMDQAQEKAHQYLMQLFAYQGNRVAALRQFELCCEILDKTLNVPPAPETQWLFRQIREGQLMPSPSAYLLFDPEQFDLASLPAGVASPG